MAELDNTTSGIVWQWLAEHKQDVLDYFAAIMREASDIQLVNFDVDRHMGLLATYVYHGLHRVDNVKPSTLLEGLTGLNDALRIRCENAASEAERQGAYAKNQGDRVDDKILELTELKQTVISQGNEAEQKGNNAQDICDAVTRWYSPFKTDAEEWISGAKTEWAAWYPTTQSTWDEWYAARLSQWASWYTNGVVPAWDAFWAGVQADWRDWTAKETARQQAELERIANELLRQADEEVRKANEQNRLSNETARQQNEQNRQSNEQIRETQEQDREAAENLRQHTFVVSQEQRQSDYEENEQDRQEEFDTNETKRQQDFEDAEAERMQAMMVTECYVDFEDMMLTFIQPEADTTEYDVEDGYLYIGIQYDDGEEEEEVEP